MTTNVEPVRTGMHLRVVDGAHQHVTFPLERSIIQIGRMTPDTQLSASHLVFPEPTVSRLHAVLTWEPKAGTYLIHHRSQTNPTVVNNVQLVGPQLLKLGDIISVGRLALVVEQAQKGEATSSPPPDAELTLNVWTADGERVTSALVKAPVLTLQFGGDRGTSPVAEENAEEQQVSLPADLPTSMRFEFGASHRTVELSQAADDKSCVRVTPGSGAELHLPLGAGQRIPLLECDVLRHQGYHIWVGPGQGSFSAGGTTISDNPAKMEALTLTFLNGLWKGAKIAIPPGRGVHLPLGPKEAPFGHPFPFGRVPSCIVTVAERDARVRAQEVAEDQFLEIDGDLVFDGESVQMVSGSKLLLGEVAFFWCDPLAHRDYSKYVLNSPEGQHEVQKARVRLGTAAHCEVRFENRDLAPVIGHIEFDSSGPTYYHQCITWPARVDGMETSAGLFAPIQVGSKIELVHGFEVTLQQVIDIKRS